MLKTIAAAALATVALAACGGGNDAAKAERMNKYISWRLDDALDDLDATDAQKQQISGIKDRLFTEVMPVVVATKAARAELVAQLDAPKADGAKIHALVDERAAAFKALAHKVSDAAIEVHGILTPTQRQTISSKVKSRMDRYGGGDDAVKAERMNKYSSARLEDALDDLDATDAQKQQISGIKDRLVTEVKPVKEANKAARAELIAQLDAPKADGAKVHALVDERAAVFTALAHKVADAAIEAHGILTPAQRSVISARVKSRMEYR